MSSSINCPFHPVIFFTRNIAKRINNNYKKKNSFQIRSNNKHIVVENNSGSKWKLKGKCCYLVPHVSAIKNGPPSWQMTMFNLVWPLQINRASSRFSTSQCSYASYFSPNFSVYHTFICRRFNAQTKHVEHILHGEDRYSSKLKAPTLLLKNTLWSKITPETRSDWCIVTSFYRKLEIKQSGTLYQNGRSPSFFC